jgi:hypothetical protein
MMAGMSLLMIVLIVIGVVIYFIPTFLGRKRGIPLTGWLFVVNLLVGWTLLGWIGCLLWAVLATPEPSSQWGQAR